MLSRGPCLLLCDPYYTVLSYYISSICACAVLGELFASLLCLKLNFFVYTHYPDWGKLYTISVLGSTLFKVISPNVVVLYMEIWVLWPKNHQKLASQDHPEVLAVLVRNNQAQKCLLYDPKCFQ